MKKIVALVLSLVMALSLCTTAFAFATTGLALYGVDENKNVNKYDLLPGTVKSYNGSTKDNTISYFTITNDVKAAGWDYTDANGKVTFISKDEWNKMDAVDQEKMNNNGTWSEEYVKVVGTNTQYLIPCEQKVAQAAVHNNGRLVNFVYYGTEQDIYYFTIAKAQSATKDLPNCTRDQYLVDGYIDDDGDFYIADKNGDLKLSVDGKIVKAYMVTGNDKYVIKASHIFAKGVKNDKMGYDVATCLICKGEFACTNNDEVATKTGYKISNTFAYSAAKAGMVYDANAYDNGYDFKWGQTYSGDYKFCWALKAGTTEEAGKTTDTTKDGVNSAKTFDAGIAMYVGMSLLSVAGSAVVIGKKKEF